MADNLVTVFTWINIMLLLIAMLLNITGIYLLYCIKQRSRRQTALIMNLSAVEVLIAIVYITDDILTLKGKTFEERIVSTCLLAGTYFTWYSAMYYITIDRFIGSHFPYKHLSIMSTRCFVRVAVISLVVGLLVGFTQMLDGKLAIHFKMYLWLPLDGIFLVLCAVTYGSIFTKISSRRRVNNSAIRTGAEVRRRHILQRNKQFFTIVSLIIFTFLILQLIPNVFLLLYYDQDETHENILSFLRICYSLAIVMDPVIYIFLQSELRALLWDKLRCQDNMAKDVISLHSLSNRSINLPNGEKKRRCQITHETIL